MTQIAKLFSFLLRLARGLRHARLKLGLVVAAGILSGACNILLLALLHRALAGAAGPGLPWLFAALCLLLPLAWFVSQYLLFSLMQSTLHELRMRICRRILATPLRRLEELGPHRLLAALTTDVMTLSTAILDIPLLCMHGAVIAGGLIYLGVLSGPLLAGLVVLLACGVASYQIPMRRASRHFSAARQAFDRLAHNFQSLTQGIKELQLHRARRRAFVGELLVPSGSEFRDESVRGARVFAAATGWGRALLFVVLGLLVFAAPEVAGIDARVLTGYALGLLFLMAPIDAVLRILPELSQAGVAQRQIEQLGLSLEEEPALGGAEPATVAADWREIRLVGITHTYRGEDDDSRFTLGPIDLAIAPGDLIFVTGGNGSGKTTLVKVLTGLYAPESGEIRVDGRPVKDEERDAYRQRFSAVFSDFHLFESLLGIGGPGLDQQAREHLRRLRLDHKVRVDGGALSTIELSQGQRKRLALLNAVLEDRPFYIFDEWAADQDPFFKEIFYREILPSLRERGKAVAVISHDDRYYDCADRLLVLENGRLKQPEAGGSTRLQPS